MRKTTLKIGKSFRLLPLTVEKLKRIAQRVGNNETAAIELMIDAYEE